MRCGSYHVADTIGLFRRFRTASKSPNDDLTNESYIKAK